MSDRHPKWQQVEPGTVIPAGQPYRVEHLDGDAFEVGVHTGRTVPLSHPGWWFVDSSWSPPLVLPTEPTWGIVVKTNFYKDALKVWRDDVDGVRYENAGIKGWMRNEEVADFIPLTDEQVARIEAAR